MQKSIGHIEGELCNRNGCTGVLYTKEQNGSCTCHLGNPPCHFCVNTIGCCPECGWNEVESLGTREVLIEKSVFWVLLRAPGHDLDFKEIKAMECEPSDVDLGTINAYMSLSIDKIDKENVYKKFYKVYEPSIGFNWNIIPKMFTSRVVKKKN